MRKMNEKRVEQKKEKKGIIFQKKSFRKQIKNANVKKHWDILIHTFFKD